MEMRYYRERKHLLISPPTVNSFGKGAKSYEMKYSCLPHQTSETFSRPPCLVQTNIEKKLMSKIELISH